jgi:hypothetical protein
MERTQHKVSHYLLDRVRSLWDSDKHCITHRSRHSAVTAVTRQRAGRYGVRVQVRSEQFSHLQKRPDRPWGTASVLLNGHRQSSPRVRRPESEAEYPCPSSGKFKNEWRYTPAPPRCIHGVDTQPCIHVACIVYTVPSGFTRAAGVCLATR